MRRIMLLALSLLLIAATGAAALQQPQRSAGHQGADRRGADRRERVMLRDVDGARVGVVRLREHARGVMVHARLRGLTPGFHGFHVHTTGICDPDAAEGPFTSAGGHYVGGGGAHGDHAGDMPSLYVADNGTAKLAFHTDAYTLDELRDADGSAVMVHAGRDNFANIPDRYTSSLSGETGPDEETLATGDAGDRAACGAIGGEDSDEVAGLVTVTSDQRFLPTVRRIRRDINRNPDLTLIEVVKHARGAGEAGLSLPPTRLLIFGNPAAGTPLLQDARTIGIDLPQKLLVWRDGSEIKVSYNDPHYLARRHGIAGQDELLDQIAELLRQLATGG
ncbi:MAG: superoxide dismutase family protein [Actinomycetota bacterium]|jgi:Cu-Zn family superoxide dismutase|nr:superoxide dismutase family protein [Euzebyaceae bacterium]MDQ3451488.1 superoxide dismutase family protein [Actinomycetota bacterium]